MEYIATFFTHFGAVKFSKTLDALKINYRMMPVPRKLSSSCGTCIRFQGEMPHNIESEEEIEGLYRILEEDYETIFNRV